jgi:hypothetical protein
MTRRDSLRRFAGVPHPLLVAAGILFLLLTGGELWFLKSRGHRDSVNQRVSENFGEALERAGIRTQAGPSR